MKKVFVAFSILLLLGLSGCNTKHLTIEQSQKNIVAYETSIQEIAANYGLVCEGNFNLTIERGANGRDISIKIGEKSRVEIYTSSSATESQSGIESFSVNYFIDDNKNHEEDFNLELFVDLVNAISGRELTMDFCNEFLEAPEGKYPASDYGYQKLNGEHIAKQFDFNFFGDWGISYILDKDYTEQLTFGGLTKQTAA
jgi:hypothetical protein